MFVYFISHPFQVKLSWQEKFLVQGFQDFLCPLFSLQLERQHQRHVGAAEERARDGEDDKTHHHKGEQTGQGLAAVGFEDEPDECVNDEQPDEDDAQRDQAVGNEWRQRGQQR